MQVGFYVVAADDTAGHVSHPSQAVKAETPFVPLEQVSLSYELRTSEAHPAFVLVPCTYGPACAGSFCLSVSGPHCGFRLEALNAQA
jgi:hypothetical protein